MTFSTHELEAAILDQFGRWAWGSLEGHDGDNLVINGVDYTFTHVADGPEHADYDSSSSLWTVFKVDGKTYRKHGYYQSHYGSEWDGYIEEVKPREVTRIEWDAV